MYTSIFKLHEMASPSRRHQTKTYYHGTPEHKDGLGIVKTGIKPPDLSTRKGSLRPIDGKIYLTEHLNYALMYTIGADMLGSQLPSSLMKSRYGWLFVIDGGSLIDIQPDEDSIGELVSDEKYSWLNNIAKKINFYGIDTYGILDNYYDVYEAVMDGEYEAWALIGKRMVNKLSDEQKLLLIRNGAHIAHTGKIIPIESWKIDKRLNDKLEPDGSNFFKWANRVK